MGTRSGIRVVPCSARIWSGSVRPAGGAHSPWLDRGTEARALRPNSARSAGVACLMRVIFPPSTRAAVNRRRRHRRSGRAGRGASLGPSRARCRRLKSTPGTADTSGRERVESRTAMSEYGCPSSGCTRCLTWPYPPVRSRTGRSRRRGAGLDRDDRDAPVRRAITTVPVPTGPAPGGPHGPEPPEAGLPDGSRRPRGPAGADVVRPGGQGADLAVGGRLRRHPGGQPHRRQPLRRPSLRVPPPRPGGRPGRRGDHGHLPQRVGSGPLRRIRLPGPRERGPVRLPGVEDHRPVEPARHHRRPAGHLVGPGPRRS